VTGEGCHLASGPGQAKDGRFAREMKARSARRRFLIDRGLPRVRFHALRHTHVSLLIAAKVDILTISRRLGHSKSSVTLDVYAHLLPGADQAAADAIAGLLK
jgi:integrase